MEQSQRQIDHPLCHKIKHQHMCKIVESIQSIFPDHKEIKLEISYIKTFWKFTNTWKSTYFQRLIALKKEKGKYENT